MTARPPFVSVADQLAAANVKPGQVGLLGRHGTRKPRKQREPRPERVAAKDVVWVWGSFGSKSHRWAESTKADMTGWVSWCGRVSKHSEPDGVRVNECQDCLKGEEEQESGR